MPVLIALVMVLLLPAGAGAAETTVLDLARPSPVSEYAGTAVVSAWDGTTASYHLSVVRDGRLTRLRVDPSPYGFDADIGPDARGRPTVVFSRCADAVRRTGCDVQLVALTGPRAGRVREPAGINTRASEYAPTLWRARLAFARSAAGRDPVVLVKALNRSSRSVRVRGAIPTRRCEVTFLERPDCTTRGRQIDDLELFEPFLGIQTGYVVKDQVGHSTTEIRLADLPRRMVRRVALLTSGEGGQSFVGLSFAADRLAWYRTCFGDPGGCLRLGGAFRYHPLSKRYEFAQDRRQFEGFALLRNGSLRVSGDESRGCESEQSPEFARGPCPLIRTTGDRYEPIATRRVRDN